jgi:hypothetical protein
MVIVVLSQLFCLARLNGRPQLPAHTTMGPFAFTTPMMGDACCANPNYSRAKQRALPCCRTNVVLSTVGDFVV